LQRKIQLEVKALYILLAISNTLNCIAASGVAKKRCFDFGTAEMVEAPIDALCSNRAM
jgi:hypothetical protein